MITKMQEQSQKEMDIIKKYGGSNIKTYTLVNNDGYTFELDNCKCDARHWRNCYGAEMNSFDVTATGDVTEDIRTKINNIQKELNEIIWI